jgi:hypothetical protein
MADRIENNTELQQVLWACYKYWQSEESSPPDERVVCYKWVLRVYEDRFGSKFHQSKLRRLVTLGFLERDDTSRREHRRYYKVIDPDRVEILLTKWDLI